MLRQGSTGISGSLTFRNARPFELDIKNVGIDILTELNWDNAIWDDGEWVSWEVINRCIALQDLMEEFPNAEPEHVELMNRMLSAAASYNKLTGRTSRMLGEIGELYCAIITGAKLHYNDTAQGSDARLGNDWIEVKTITPVKNADHVEVKRSGNFNKVFVVKVHENYSLSGRMFDRKEVASGKPKGTKKLKIKWDAIVDDGQAF